MSDREYIFIRENDEFDEAEAPSFDILKDGNKFVCDYYQVLDFIESSSLRSINGDSHRTSNRLVFLSEPDSTSALYKAAETAAKAMDPFHQGEQPHNPFLLGVYLAPSKEGEIDNWKRFCRPILGVTLKLVRFLAENSEDVYDHPVWGFAIYPYLGFADADQYDFEIAIEFLLRLGDLRPRLLNVPFHISDVSKMFGYANLYDARSPVLHGFLDQAVKGLTGNGCYYSTLVHLASVGPSNNPNWPQYSDKVKRSKLIDSLRFITRRIFSTWMRNEYHPELVDTSPESFFRYTD